MKPVVQGLVAFSLVACSSSSPEADVRMPDARMEVGAIGAPTTRTADVVDDYFGNRIADPYRWLEDQDGAETAAWVAEQNAVTMAYLEGIPQRTAIRERLTQLWNYPRYSAPVRAGDRWVYGKNDGLQNQQVLYVTPDPGIDGEVLMDVNELSEDGTVALSGSALSDGGRYMAFALASSGSDWVEWQILDLDTKQVLPDRLQWSKFAGAAWTHNEEGFFYQRFPAPEEGQTFEAVNEQPQLCYHELGTDQADDIVIYERPDEPTWMFSPTVTEDGRYLVISISQGTDTRNRVAYADLEDGIGPVQPLLMDFDAAYGFLGNTGDVFYFQTDNAAPQGRVIALDIHKPKPEPVITDPAATELLLGTEPPISGDPPPPDPLTATDPPEMTQAAGEAVIDEWFDTLVPEAADTLVDSRVLGGNLLLLYLQDASSRMVLSSLDGSEQTEVLLPEMGSVSGVTGKQSDDIAYFGFQSFVNPSAIYRYDVSRNEVSVFREPQVDFDTSGFVTRRVFLQSRDGTRLPLFLVHKRGIELDGSNPTMLYGYGGFNISMNPRFSVSNLAWVEMGGVYAHAVLRGGGEYGEMWHQAGMLENKQNVFDDFIAHADYLIRNGYTSSEKLAITGGSNGGLLVGAALTQRPELFGAAVPAVGVMDMLRYHKFTIGWAWVPEYGSSEDEAMFEVLRQYSPLHNIHVGRSYPPTLVTTGDHDDRVLPGHSYKFAATLQRSQGGSAPVLIRVDTKSGHGSGKPTDKQIEEAADRLAFLVHTLGMR